jgi:hypothetical protein
MNHKGNEYVIQLKAKCLAALKHMYMHISYQQNTEMMAVRQQIDKMPKMSHTPQRVKYALAKSFREVIKFHEIFHEMS